MTPAAGSLATSFKLMVKGQTKMFLLKTGQMTKSSLAQSMLYEHFTSYS